jgi:hypothetical protein
MERASRYDAIVATLVGVCALVVSAYTAYIQRQQVRAQVYPIIQVTSGWSDDEIHVNFANKGSGPALIRNVVLTADGKAIHSWIELVNRGLGDTHVARGLHFNSIGRSTISAGEQLQVFGFDCEKVKKVGASPGKVPEKLEPPDEACGAILRLIRQMSINVCYCSTLNDCSLFEDGPDRDATTTDVRGCPKRNDDSFN